MRRGGVSRRMLWWCGVGVMGVTVRLALQGSLTVLLHCHEAHKIRTTGRAGCMQMAAVMA